jgi:hypothetical protein
MLIGNLDDHACKTLFFGNVLSICEDIEECKKLDENMNQNQIELALNSRKPQGLWD